ncbi:MAG: hybrid sensor histidine kinase/response regulator, partial [Eubacteriales bacterium]
SAELLKKNMLESIRHIDLFAKDKGDELYKTSVDLKRELHRQLFMLMFVMLLFSLIISYILIRNIRKPLKELNNVVLRFQKGEMDVRNQFESKNEVGVLSSSINSFADYIQKNIILNKDIENLTEVMIGEDDKRIFFRTVLGAIADYTGAQTAAVYLLSNDKQNFDYFESIGMDDSIKISYPADCFEGDFGAALLTRKLQYIQNIPEDTRFLFQTVYGKFIPRELITIPVLSDNKVIAIISLAAVSKFKPQVIELINKIIVTMSSRIESILAYDKIKEFTETLTNQYRELDSQKTELSLQTIELTQQNTELEMQKKQLFEAGRLKTIFLSNMSHELRTPLNSVIALSGVLNRRLSNRIPEEEYSYLEIIERNGRNLLALINDVLDISRIEAGREDVNIEIFNANNLITELINTIKPLIIKKNIELLYKSKDSDLIINSDSDKLRHILQNLIDNAVKFTEEGNVTVSVQKVGNSIEIKVTDTGIGIAAEHLPFIFDEFRQADGSTSRKYGGTGLGLAIAKKYTELLGGSITVNSSPDIGSEFKLTLPLSYTEENKTADEIDIKSDYKIKQSHGQPVKDTAGKNILLVEDNESAVIQIKDLAEEMGYQISVAHDGSEALEFISRTIPDAMILDLMMPVIDGFEVLKNLRNAEKTAHVPVLILTSKHITKDELKFLKRNNIHQLIQKGNVNRIEFLNALTAMLSPVEVKKEKTIHELPNNKEKPVVLIAEDNPDNMVTIKALFADKYTLLEATNGKEVIRMAQENIPDLILMDIALPEIDGITAFKMIREQPKLTHIPIIAVTASSMVHDRETILSHGFDAYISKPIEEKEFDKVINGVLYGK